MHILIHADFETSRVLEDWAKSRGLTPRIIGVYRGDTLPEISEIRALGILGGPMSVYDPIPWVQKELELISKVIAKSIPVMGICLGSQFLAKALGVAVGPNTSLEIGWFPLEFTPGALGKYPFLPETQAVFHWHGDTYPLPPGTQSLGSSEATPCQGFFGPGILGLQFHPEVTPEEVSGFLRAGPLPQGKWVQNSTEILNPTRPYEKNKNLFTKLLDSWIQTACPLCKELAPGCTIENTPGGPGVHQELPMQILNLRPLHQDLLLYYRNTETRLLECPCCTATYRYQVVDPSNPGEIREKVIRMNKQELLDELKKVAEQQKLLAESYGSTYSRDLPAVLAAVQETIYNLG